MPQNWKKTVFKNKTVNSTNILVRLILISDNILKQIIKDLLYEYLEEDLVNSKTTMDGLTRHVTD